MLNGLLHANGVCRCCCGSTAVVAALEESSSASSLFSSSLSSSSPSRNRRKADTDVGDGEVSVGGGGGGGSDRCDLSSPASSSLPSATTGGGGNTGATPVMGWWVILGQDRERGGDRCTSFVWSLQSSKPGRRLLSVGPGLDALFGLQRSVSKAMADDGYGGISGKIYKGATVATVAKKNRILIWTVVKLA